MVAPKHSCQCSSEPYDAFLFHHALFFSPSLVFLAHIAPFRGLIDSTLIRSESLRALVQRWLSDSPAGRRAQVTDLQAAVVDLTYDGSNSTAGHNLVIEGGQSRWQNVWSSYRGLLSLSTSPRSCYFVSVSFAVICQTGLCRLQSATEGKAPDETGLAGAHLHIVYTRRPWCTYAPLVENSRVACPACPSSSLRLRLCQMASTSGACDSHLNCSINCLCAETQY